MSPPFSKTQDWQPWAVQLPGMAPPGSIVAFQIPRKEKPAGYSFISLLHSASYFISWLRSKPLQHSLSPRQKNNPLNASYQGLQLQPRSPSDFLSFHPCPTDIILLPPRAAPLDQKAPKGHKKKEEYSTLSPGGHTQSCECGSGEREGGNGQRLHTANGWEEWMYEITREGITGH